MKNTKILNFFFQKQVTEILLVILLFISSIILRFWFFWQPSFSGDEATYTTKAISIANGIVGLVNGSKIDIAFLNILRPILQHAHAPMEILILVPFVGLHPREFFLRLIYVLIGCLILIIAYLVLKKLRNQHVALAFLIMFGTSVYAIWWSQTAMYQSLSMAASIIISLSIINFYKNPSPKALLFLAISPALGLLVFPDFALFIPAILWLIYDKKVTLGSKTLFIRYLSFLSLSVFITFHGFCIL